MLEFLRRKSLVNVVKKGCVLSRSGKRLVSGIEPKVRAVSFVDPTVLSFGKPCFGVVLIKTRIESALKYYEISVKAGADGATLLNVAGNSAEIAGLNKRVSLSDKAVLAKSLCFEGGDAVILSFAENRSDAERGAWAVSLSLLSN